MTRNTVYIFGDFRLDPRERRLLRNREPIELTPKAFNTLLILIENSGHLLTKQELMRKVWPDSHVEEPNLTVTIAMLRKALGEEDGRQHIETVPRQGYRFATAVEQLIEEKDAQAIGISKRSLMKPLVAAVFLVLIAGLLAVYLVRVRRNRESSQSPLPGSVRNVAVLGFKNLSGNPEDAWLTTAFAEWLAAELQVRGSRSVVPSENVAYMATDLSLAPEYSYPPETLFRIRKNLNADLLVLGAFAASGDMDTRQIRIDVRIVNAANAQVLASRSETANTKHLLDLVGSLGAQLREELRESQLSAAEVRETRNLIPREAAVAQLYIEGIEKLHHFDPQGASQLLEQAVRAEPDYALAHSALATAWSTLGYDAKARGEAERAMDLASALPREQSLWIEATYRALDRDWSKALQLYNALWTFDPDNLQYGLELARTQTSAGKPGDALTTLKKLRNSPQANDPGIDLMETRAHEVQGDFQAEQAAAERALTKGRERGAQRLVALALLAKGWALDNLGQTTEAIKVDKEAQQISASIGDRFDMARAIKNVADALDDQGELAEAVATYEQALQLFREIGSQGGAAISLNNMAFALRDQGNLPEAKAAFAEAIRICKVTGDQRTEALSVNGMAAIFWREGDLTAAINMYAQALAEFKDNGDKSNMASVLGNMALVLEDGGDLANARSKMDESLSLYRQTGSTTQVARTLGNIGELLLRQGDLDGGQSRFEDALSISRQTNNQSTAAYSLINLANLATIRGNLTDAMQKENEALSLRLQMKEQGTIAESRSDIASLDIDLGRLTEAEALARQAAEQFEKEGEINDRACVLAILAESLFLQGKRDESQSAIELALQLSRKTEDRRVRMFIVGKSAHVSAGTAVSTELLQRLNSAIVESKKYHYIEHEFELRLALGNLQIRMGKISEGRSTLSALEKDTTAKGFMFISGKVSAALKDLSTPLKARRE